MASTKSSALDYVRNARVHLVNGLHNLSVILDNLYLVKVLRDEEVSKIQAEKDDYDKNRKILEFVTAKGEAACYEFLRIIDMTRKRTIRRTLPEKNSLASIQPEKFDLHEWISCFPFKEDTPMDKNCLQGARPCIRYQAKLKAKAQKMSNDFWMSNKKLFEKNNKPDLSYRPLVLDTQGSVSPSKIKKFKSKKSRMPRTKKLKTYIPEDKPEVSPDDLLKTNKNILLVGKPGIGKTALTHEMLRLWSERDNKELDYMFYFDMREQSQNVMTLEDLLFRVFSEPDEGEDEVLKDIKRNSENVTLIFDGITDLSSSVVRKLVKKDLLPDAKVILTCRTGDEEESWSTDFHRVEVKGFSERTIKTYFSAILGDNQEILNVELLTLCHVPTYALMVAACFSSETPDNSPQPCSITEIYINIVRFCLQMNSNQIKNKQLNSFISNKREEILYLAEVAFKATEAKSVNLTGLPCEDSCVLSFLKSLDIQVSHTETKTTYAFLHYTMQEFFAALWLLKNSDKIKDFFQQCLKEENKHMKHLIPFMCRLLSDKYPSLMTCLLQAQELKNISNWFFEEVINTFSPQPCSKLNKHVADSENADVLFLCQCFYESQCPEACICFLDKLNYEVDLSENFLDPYHCCAVAYVVNQSKQREINLDIEDSMVSQQGMRQLFGCLKNVQWCDSLSRQLWDIFLLSEEEMDYISLLNIDGNQLHLPVQGEKQLFERAVKVMQKIISKVKVRLHWDRATTVCQSLCGLLSKALPYIESLSFVPQSSGPSEEPKLFGNLFCAAAEREQQTGEKILELLSSVCTYETSPPNDRDINDDHNHRHQCDFLLDLFSHVKDYETETGLSVLPSLQSVFQSAPSVWSIDLSERKTSILLEVLKLQPEKKQVELTGCSGEESEVRSFLQCLPYISQLSFSQQFKAKAKCLGNLICAAAEREQQTGEKILVLLSSKCRYETFPLKDNWCHFLLDLYSETETGLSVLPSLQSVFQSAPSVWTIDLSQRKTSILLEVLKLQPEKKQVELRGCSGEESEVRSFLQCLPYISQLSFSFRFNDGAKFLGNLFCAAAEREQQTGEKILELLSSVCRYETFPYHGIYDEDDQIRQCDILLDLCSHVKDCETKTGLSVLPSLQSVFQSAPSVWFIDLSQRKTSILLEVLKLQPEKKQVQLTGCSGEESEVRSFLQCLPYISQLSYNDWFEDEEEVVVKFLGNLFCAAAEREQQTGEKKLELLSSVCRYETFPYHEIYDEDDQRCQCDVLLGLYSHVKDYETKTGLSVLPSLQSVFQSAPSVWTIDLSQRKTSILLEVLKLQPEKKLVELRGCSDEESEVRSFLQCLPYISRLSSSFCFEDVAKFLGNLFCAAAEREQQTGEKILELLSSVCRYGTFPYDAIYDEDYQRHQCDVLLDLYSHVKDCETKTGLSVLPSLQSVFQSAPSVWFIDLSERKTSILLEVLKLQPEKKQVQLTGCSGEESEVRSFLQCLPYISQLSFSCRFKDGAKFLGNLFCAAAETEQQTGEKKLELLSSVCTYGTFPYHEIYGEDVEGRQCDFLLGLYSHVKDCETKTGLSVLPSLQSVFQSAPSVWFIDLSQRKTSILLEVLKLQPEKKQVKLRGCSGEESEVRSFLQCLPYISQLSLSCRFKDGAKFLGNLFCAAAEREQQTGEKILELLSSVCRYETFPYHEIDDEDYQRRQCDFLLGFYSHVKDYETKTGLSVLPSLQSVFQSAPSVWTIDLSQRKTSILLEVLKLQPEKKQVELKGCSDEESEVRSFLQCLPYISQLSCDPDFFQSVCSIISVKSREEVEQLASLLQLLRMTLPLKGELPRKTCRSVGRVLGLCGSNVDLILTPTKISARGAFSLFRHTTKLRSLRLSHDMSLLLSRWVKTGRVVRRFAVEELSLAVKKAPQSDRVLLRVVSSLASLLRYWTVAQLHLTEFRVSVLGLIPLLLHRGPLLIKLSEEIRQQLVSFLSEIQDKDLTWSSFSKVGGDLTSCCLNWEVLLYLLQQSDQILTVNLRKNSFLEKSVRHLLPFLDRIICKRPSPSFVLTAIRELYEAQASAVVPTLLRSFDHEINLTCREMDSVDCAALLFVLKHSDAVKLNLLWTTIPTEELQSILLTLDTVSQLSVDRNLLLRLVQCCAASDLQQRAAVSLLRTVRHRLDLSCSSCAELPEQGQSESLSLSVEDCGALSAVLTHGGRDAQLDLNHCEVQDSGLDRLFPVLGRVRLRASKELLLRLVYLVPVTSERDAVRRAQSLCRALDGELDLSHSALDHAACEGLARMMDLCDELTELDLSHCRLTDRLLLALFTQLHKAQVLDLSHNQITDASTGQLLQLLSINPSIQTVRLFNNNIVDKTPFRTHKQFEIW